MDGPGEPRSKNNQIQKYKYCMITLTVWSQKKIKFIEIGSRMVVAIGLEGRGIRGVLLKEYELTVTR
jgi:hypothetical protein